MGQWVIDVEAGADGAVTVVARRPERAEGRARVTEDRRGWSITVDPGGEAAPVLLDAALDVVAGRGPVHLWVVAPTAADDAAAAAAGFEPSRDLLQLRRRLPVGETSVLPTRPFEPGRDDEAWLEVNNRAFHWHPEQGGWDLATLKAREAESWFDREGFLLHEADGALDGFCWTKIHADTDPPMGEIYVIAVDPDVAGRGLGRELGVAGLQYLSERGLRTGMLYVDASNAPARRLYDDLGFELDHVERAYTDTR
jgi:mycothiol synthase